MLGLLLSVTNSEPLKGGRELASVQASEADRKRTKNLLMKKLESVARAGLADEIGSNDMLFEDTFGDSQILSEEYDPPAGAVGTTLTLTMQVEYSVLYASASDLAALAALALNASLPSGFRAASASDVITVKPVSAPLSTTNTHALDRARGTKIVSQINVAQVTQMSRVSVHDCTNTTGKNFPLAIHRKSIFLLRGGRGCRSCHSDSVVTNED